MKRKLQFKRILACSIVLLLMLFVMPGLTSNVMAASDGTGITETIDINLSYKMDKIHSGAQDYYSRNPGKDIYGGVYYENGKIVLLTTTGIATDWLEQYKDDTDVVVRRCDYSYAQLESALGVLLFHINEIPGYVSIGLAVHKNRVILIVTDITAFEKMTFDWFPVGMVTVMIGQPLLQTDEVDGVYYAMRDMNVRQGPGSKRYEVVARLRAGDKVTVTTCSKRWSEIDYNGSPAYVFSAYLTQDIVKAYRNHAFIRLIGRSKVKSVELAEGKEANLTYRGGCLFDAESLLSVELKRPYAPLKMRLAVYADSESAKAKFLELIDASNAPTPDISAKFYLKDNCIACWFTSATLNEYTRTAERFDKAIQDKFYEFADDGEK